ncbi:MAG: undecaprenyl/decaprenyl-phosphate alpha-N-acetylglucosaminyl 1-phosphate transferase, partial [Nitrospirae bacterium]|nr:undecaprenyl/decaprenyl-phosphate alpha-N-acetylglucosaminyl 1-phosphate transferase [Nitrospirota bacterium]
TNAVNLSDGLDGLAGGLSVLSFGVMAYLAYLSGDWEVLTAATAILGGIWGFLRFNTHPARIFMGDGGSQFLGFSMGVMALLLTDVSRGPYGPELIPLLIGLPLLDTLGVMGQRLSEGRSPFLPDRNHIHHKLLSAGLFSHEAVILIYALQAGMVSLAYLMRWQPEGAALGVYGGIALLVLALFFLAGRRSWRRDRPDRDRSLSLVLVRRVKAFRWVREVPFHLLGTGVFLFLVLSVFIPRSVPADFGLFAAVLSGLLLLCLVVFRRAAPLLVRLGLYVGGSFVVFLAERSPLIASWPVPLVFNLFFGVMAVLIVVAIQFDREKPFQTTPFDYLAVLIVLMVSFLPETRMDGVSLGLLAAKILVLFFAYELILNRFSKRLPHLGVLSLWVLMVLGVRSGIH